MTDQQAERLIKEVERNNRLTESLLLEIRASLSAKEDLLNYTDAAKRLGITRQTVAEYVRQNRLHQIERGGKRGIPESELNRISAVKS